MRAEDLHQVQGRGQHRLQHFGRNGRCLVSVATRRHFGDRGCCCAAPGAQIGRNPVGGEQVTVVDQIDDHLRGCAPDAWALLANDDAVGVDHVASERQVFLAEVGVELGEGSDAPLIEPAEELAGLVEAAVAAGQMQWGAVGAWQTDHGIVIRGQQRQDQLLGDQPPAGVGDGGEVESASVKGHLDREPDHVGEIPQVVVEYRSWRAARQREPGVAADVRAGERRPWLNAGCCGRDCARHAVRSSGRKGISSSLSVTRAAATASSAGSKRSRIWSIRAA